MNQMNHLFKIRSLLLIAFVLCVMNAKAQNKPAKPVQAEPDRSSLPIREPARPSYKDLDVRNTKPPQRFDVKAPKGAPNVVIVLIDDMGFGVSEAFGGPIQMPTFDKLAKSGLRYNRFHTTALCAPTRTCTSHRL